ncbi:MAG TPA: Rrf2 family transcriptional regulator [Thermoanaerobaculia bacterium]|nr:Rrf2 family transcriptional regulator [Thermoanaerobaculia bacterium]
MSANSRMTVAIHILSYLAVAERKRPDPVTSDRIAHSVATNPVVIRRMMGALRRAGLVASRRGAHAGWTLAKSPEAITLLDVYRAVGEGPLFALHASPPNPHCHVARGLKPALGRVYGALEKELARQLAGTTIGQMLADTVR